MSTSEARRAAPAILAALLSARAARAEGEIRPRMPEPILTESITDLDGTEAGEVEVDLNVGTLGALSGGDRIRGASVEAEWRATSRLGLVLEPSYDVEGGAGAPGLHAGVSYAVLHDLRHDLHVQVEAAARLFGSEHSDATIPGETALPLSLGVRAGIRAGHWTFRPSAGIEVGPRTADVPLWAGAALLHELGAGGALGFFGVEVEADGAQATPFVVAPNYVVDLALAGVPCHVGLAIPWVVGAARATPQIGTYLRLLVEL